MSKGTVHSRMEPEDALDVYIQTLEDELHTLETSVAQHEALVELGQINLASIQRRIDEAQLLVDQIKAG